MITVEMIKECISVYDILIKKAKGADLLMYQSKKEAYEKLLIEIERRKR